MIQQGKVLSSKLEKIAEEEKIKNPKITIADTVKAGYLGIPSKILIEESDDGRKKKSLHLFLKSAPTGETARDAMPIQSVFANEISMYSEVLPAFLKFQKEIGVHSPFQSYAKCYKFSKEVGDEFLIFEDLNKSDFVLWDKTKPMSTESVEFVFRQTALYHAVSFAVQKHKPVLFKELSRKLYNEILPEFLKIPSMTKTFLLNCESALKCIDPVEDSIVYSKFRRFIDNDAEKVVLNKADEDEVVIIHGDSWCNNFMFKFEDPKNPSKATEMVFLDWQCSRTSSPVIDLSYFLYCNGPQEALDNLSHYLNIYYSTLTSALKEMETDVEKVFPFSSLQSHWKKYAKFGLTMACTLLNVYYNPSHAEATNLSVMFEKGEDFTTAFVSTGIENNEDYRKRMGGIVTHFVNNNFI